MIKNNDNNTDIMIFTDGYISDMNNNFYNQMKDKYNLNYYIYGIKDMFNSQVF